MENFDYTVIRSSRKTLSLQIKPDGTVVVRSPMRLPEREIRRFLQEKAGWIEKTLQKVNEEKQQGSRLLFPWRTSGSLPMGR